jgi:hypothetical protein
MEALLEPCKCSLFLLLSAIVVGTICNYLDRKTRIK